MTKLAPPEPVPFRDPASSTAYKTPTGVPEPMSDVRMGGESKGHLGWPFVGTIINLTEPPEDEEQQAPTPLATPQDVGRFLKRLREHLDYLRRVSIEGTHPPITHNTAAQARRAWWAVWEAAGFALPIPAACTGPDGQMLYVWDRGRHHLELEIIPEQPAEFFYRDRETGELWGEDYTVGDPVPTGAVQKIWLFV